MLRLRAAAPLLVALLATAPLLASCSSGSSDASGSAGQGASSDASGGAASSAVCRDLDAIKTSMAGLKDIKVGQGGLNDLATTLTTVQDQVRRLSQDAKTQYAPETAQVRSSAQALKASLRKAASDPSLDSLGQVKDDLTALGTSFDRLSTAVSQGC